MELKVLSTVGIGTGILTTLTLLGSLVAALDDPILSPLLFYPFGPDVGDSVMPQNDDGSSGSVMIDVGFPFFATSNTQLFVNTNGAISFGQAVTTFTPQSFPVANRLIAPYWCDINTELNSGRIYYRQSTDDKLLSRATQDVVKSFSSKGLYFFKARWIFIATWHNVTYFGGSATTPVNSFQAVLITDGKHSMAMFNYGWISWTAGTVSGGNALTGLGGTAAQVGFNAGDNVTYFAVPGSRTDRIVDVAEHSNVRMKGRWFFRVDSATIEASGNCESLDSKCRAYQEFSPKAEECFGVAPAFECPTLEGPVVIQRRWVEFYCAINTTETSDQAAFDVTFLFNGEPVPNVPSVVVRSPTPKATLHEKHLTHKLLGKWISCRVFSYWSNSAADRRSKTLTSSNSYWAGIEVSPDMISVHEGDPNPAVLTIKSTLPIACRQEGIDICDLTLRFTSTKDILIRGKDNQVCSHTLTEADWKEEERKAYKTEERIKIYAKIDYAVSAPRFNTLTIDIDTLPQKFTANGERYTNMWSKHSLPDIMVYHHDVPQGVCRSTGDPNLMTFDHLFYSVYASGQFTYVQSTRGSPIEVQVRHKPCGQTVSCVCGVAIREKDLILVADKCTDEILRTVTFNNLQTLPEGAGIKQSVNGRSFEMTLPSKVRVVGYVRSWGLNIEIYVTSAEYRRIEGLCGSFDGNRANDLKVKDTNRTYSPSSASLPEVVASWKIPLGSSLFDGKLSNLNSDPTEDQAHESQSFCSCPEPATGCGNGVVDNRILNDVQTNDPFPKNTLDQVEDLSKNIILARRRRRQAEQFAFDTDDIDREYNGSAFNYDSPEPHHRPENASGVTESVARTHCRRVLWDESPVRSTCENVVAMSDVDGIIDKCVSDIRMTGDLMWADDKIPEIQNLCIFEALTANITESNSTIEEITSLVREITAVVCLPQDCSGHGTCRNGSCVCDRGYVGSDCALSEDAVPNIVRSLGPSTCDVSRFPCQKVALVTKNVTSLPTLVCQVKVIKVEDSKQQSFKTSASVESLETASCKLPTDVLHGSLRPLLLFRTNSSRPDQEPTDIYSLPQGSPVLHYSISISNNGRGFSNAYPLTVYDSRCYSCDADSCSQKKDVCLINGYCFANGQRNPFNPECDICNSSVSTTAWTKAKDLSCDPCLSSPCGSGSVCQSSFKGKYRCTQRDMTVIVVAIVTVVMVILTIVILYFIIRRK